MKWFFSNLIVVFWAVIFGEIIGYIGGTLEKMTYDPMTVGVITAVGAFVAVNGIWFLNREGRKQASSAK
ncbi:YjzD family protein [Levilactobacillus paucivorans]|uniref:YjzD family protein n=1 Tax=Levilactobacillus paucivorans TaxID=616990 RepID=UPI000708C8CD|nr:YjzD family protein [Levilactobacillus paucivorans]